MSRARGIALAVASALPLILLAAALLLRGGDSDPEYARLIEMNSRLYEELKLGDPFVQSPNGATYPEEDASVNAILEYCRSFDLPPLEAAYAEDAAGTALVAAFADSCLQIDAPVLLGADDHAPYRTAVEASVARIEKALTPH